MHNLVPTLGGVLILLAGVSLGWRRWIRPRAAAQDAQGKALLFFLTLIFVGGFVGPFFWWTGQSAAFPWRLPPLAGRMLAAAGWSFALVTFAILEQPTRRRVRLCLILLAVYLAPLDVAIFAFHLNRLDFSASITYGFLALLSVAAIASLWFLRRQPAIEAEVDDTPAALRERLWLGLLAVVLGLWGIALFLSDRGPFPLIWVWPGDLLTSRLIAVMLLTLAVGSSAALRYAETAQLMLTMAAAYGLGVVLAGLWNSFAGKPVPLAYVATFSIVLLGSAILLGARLQAAPRRGGGVRTQGA